MEDINENQNPLNRDDNSASSRWFGQRAAQIGSIAGFTFAAYKMKGPVGGLVKKYLDKNYTSQLAKEYIKSQDNQDWLLSDNYQPRPKYFGIPDIKQNTEFDPNNAENIPESVRTGGYDSPEIAERNINSIQDIEDKIVYKVTDNISYSTGGLPRIDTGPIMPKISSFDIGLKDDIFWEVRVETLIEFLSRHAPINMSDYADISAMQSRASAKDKKAIAELHKLYYENFSTYSNAYLAKIKKAHRRSRQKFNEYINNRANVGTRIQESEAKKFLFGSEDLSDDATLPLHMRFAADIRSRKLLYNHDDLRELFSTGGSITAGNIDKRAKISIDSPFRELGHYDYGPHIKRLMNVLDALRTEDAQELNIQDIRCQILGGNKDAYLNITFDFTNGDTEAVEVPLTRYGRLPAGSGGGSYRLDRNIPLPNGPRNVRDMSKQNTSQQAIVELTDALEGRIMEEARHNPQTAMKKIRDVVSNVIMRPPTGNHNLTDAVKAMVIEPAYTYKGLSSKQRRVLDDAVVTGNNLKHMSNILSRRENAINIGIDFEAIAPNVGPQHMVTSNDTQLTKAGILVQEFSNGKMNVIGAHEIVSDHGADIVRNIGVSKSTAQWLQREIDPDDLKLLDDDPEKIFDFWVEQKLRPATKDYRNLRGGRQFRDNIQFAEHVGEVIFQAMEKAEREGKDVFITTKNGNEFDLPLLEKYAPIAWAKIRKKHRHMIDLQSIAKLRKDQYGERGSLALNRMINKAMGDIDPDAPSYNIDKKGQLLNFLKWMNGKKGYRISSTSFLDTLEKQGIRLSEAHSTPLGDIMAEVFMALHEVNRYQKGDKLYSDLDDLHKQLARGKRILGLDEQKAEYYAIETGHTVYGRVASAALLSQGNIQKELVSLIGPNNIALFPDNKLSKQPYQNIRGHANLPNDSYLDRRGMSESEKARYRRRNYEPTMRTKTLGYMEEYLRYVEDDQNNFSRQLFGGTIFSFNPFIKEGFQSWSDEVLKNRTFHLDSWITLDPGAYVGEARISDNIAKIQMLTNIKAKKKWGKNEGKIPVSIYQDAMREVIAENKSLAHIPAGREVTISDGKNGVKTVKAEVAGQIEDIVTTGSGDNIRMFAKIKHVAAGSDLNGLSMMIRMAGSNKANFMTTQLMSLGSAKGGPMATSTSDFLNKGYVGTYKTLLANEIVERYNRVLEDSNTPERQKVLARQSRDNFLLKLNAKATSDGIIIDDDASISDKLLNITDETTKKKAQQFIGNANIKIDDLHEHMRMTGMVWNLQEAQQYYKLFGGESAIRKKINADIRNARRSIDKMVKSKEGALRGLDKRLVTKLKLDLTRMSKNFWLPDLNKLARGEKIPTILGFHKMYPFLENSPIQFGMKVLKAESVAYGLFEGMQTENISTKAKKDILQMIDVTGHNADRNAIDAIKRSVNLANSHKYNRAANTVINFTSAMMSSAFTTGKELKLDELNILIDRIGDIDLARDMKRKMITDEDLTPLQREALDSILDSEDKGRLQELIDNVTDNIKKKNKLELYQENTNLITTSAASRMAHLASKKGVYALSMNDELGSAFSFEFDFNNMPSLGIDLTENNSGDRLRNFFKRLSQTKGSIVEADPDDPNVFRLKKLIYHADEVPEDIHYNDFFSRAAKYGHEGHLAMKKFKEVAAKAKRKFPDSPESYPGFIETRERAKSAWLKYLTKGFLMDSSSSYAKAFDFSIHAPYTRIGSGKGVLATMLQIHEMGGFEGLSKHKDIISAGIFKNWTTEQLIEGDATINRILEDTAVTDVFVTKSWFDKMEFQEKGRKISVKKHLRNIFGDKSGAVFDAIERGERIPIFSKVDPTYQNAIDGVLGLNLRVIPDHMAEHLNMNANVANVFDEIANILARDFDGDKGQFVYNALNNAKEYMSWQKEHRERLNAFMQRVDVRSKMIEDNREKTWGGYKAAFQMSDKDGLYNVEVTINDRGQLVYRRARTTDLDDTTSNFIGELVSKTVQHYPEAMTNRSVKDAFDKLAMVGVAKDNIGLFTNTFRKRVSQVLQANVVKNPADAALLIGNSTYGLAKLAQDSISMTKHEVGEEVAKAVKVFTDSSYTDMDAQASFKKWFFDSYSGVDVSPEKVNELYEAYTTATKYAERLDSIDDIALERRHLENITMGRTGSDAIDLYMSSDINGMIRRMSEFRETHSKPTRRLAETLGKKMKFQQGFPNFMKRSGKMAAVGAAAYLALNFFRPSQLSNSANPMDAFTDLGIDFNGDYDNQGLELRRGIPLDTVDASFSKEAYVKLGGFSEGKNKQDRSAILRNMLRRSFGGYDSFVKDYREDSSIKYSDQTSYIGLFGSSTLERRAGLL